MNQTFNVFQKTIGLVIALLAPIVFLYAYSNHVSEQVIREQTDQRVIDRLAITLHQLETNMEQLAKLLVTLSVDSQVNQLKNLSLYTPYEQVMIRRNLFEKLKLYRQTNTFLGDIAIYDGDKALLLRVNDRPVHDTPLLDNTGNWTYVPEEDAFYYQINRPSYAKRDAASLVIEANFPADYIRELLASIDMNDNVTASPFLYHKEHGIISDDRTQLSSFPALSSLLFSDAQGTTRLKADDQTYHVSYLQSSIDGWQLVDFIRLDTLLAPITVSRAWFYGSIALLVSVGLLAAILLYRHVHVPIRSLIQGIQRIRRGDYSVRLEKDMKNEFRYVFMSFNQMAARTQELIEEVLQQKIHSQEATLRQLQYQINPHFLYNSLFYIKNMAKIRHNDAVEAMALHLGHYYRYMTQNQLTHATLEEECKFAGSFLNIHQLRVRHLSYEISLPEHMRTIRIPRLLLQPLVENAVEHGMNSLTGHGRITVSIQEDGEQLFIAVSDNGQGMENHALIDLREKIYSSIAPQSQIGLWNVHQRMVHHLPGGSTTLQSNAEGGLTVVLIWNKRRNEDG
ncbi:sensor histidine kinase [Aureibacillus halotolerans]|uniref:Two-component system sensor histidine kinase YesM n=1 Tax=Aureibacillus halotolerans TaxID=1508390 RepID=A0A4R6U4L1_9BACI|nr:histidine kinase [Aureibacillus halotolerans]TDQ41091.1 two-component system sensor histidine kinase YesM [Aureibacillus halotolerans]